MSEQSLTPGDRVVVVRPDSIFAGREGSVYEDSGDIVKVRFVDGKGEDFVSSRFGDVTPIVSFRSSDVTPAVRHSMFKKGDRVRVKLALSDSVDSCLPMDPLDVMHDQRPEDIYIRVSQWNGLFLQGYALHPEDLELVSDEPQTGTIYPPTPNNLPYMVGDWVKLNPDTPWADQYWAKHAAEIVEIHEQSSVYYLLRFVDGGESWHTSDGFTLVRRADDDVLDRVDEQPGEDLYWVRASMLQPDGSIVDWAIEKRDNEYGLRLWVNSFDLDDDGKVKSEPYSSWPIDLTPNDARQLSEVLFYTSEK